MLVELLDVVRRLFLSKLEGFGVTHIDALGQRFDPALHEAVTMVPTHDPAQDGVVCGVLTPRYFINEDVQHSPPCERAACRNCGLGPPRSAEWRTHEMSGGDGIHVAPATDVKIRF